jgi:hypothetical protein
MPSRMRCAMNHAVLTLTPSIRCSWCVLMPFFEDVRRWTARNQVVSGIFDRSSKVPTVAVKSWGLWRQGENRQMIRRWTAARGSRAVASRSRMALAGFPCRPNWAKKSSVVIRPAQPVLADRPPAGPGWLFEIKHDGFRIVSSRPLPGPLSSPSRTTRPPGGSYFRGLARARSCKGRPGRESGHAMCGSALGEDRQ